MNRLSAFSRVALPALMLFLQGCQQQPSTSAASNGEPGSEPAPTATELAGVRTAERVVIGVAGPFTGDSAEFGAQARMALDLAAARVNAEGGIEGKTLVLRYEDDAGTPQEAQSVAARLTGDPEVVAVVGHFHSSCSLAGKAAYTEAKMVMFSPSSTNEDVTADSDYVFRNIFADGFQGRQLADYVGSVLRHRKVAVLFDNDDYGTGLKESFKARASQLGVDIVIETAFTRDTNDFRSQLETIRFAAPDIILIAGLYRSGAVIAKQAREMSMATPLIGGEGLFSPGFISLAGEAAEGTLITSPFLFELGGERARDFFAAFRNKYNKDPDGWAALSYDALTILVEAARKGGATREGIHAYLKSLNSPEAAYDGLAGKVYFDVRGNCRKPVQVAQVRNSRFVPAARQLDHGSTTDDAPQGQEAAETTAPAQP